MRIYINIMAQLSFKNWLIKEFADYGFDDNQRNTSKGGTDIMDGDTVFKVVNTSKIMTELTRLSSIGPNKPMRRWSDMVEYGDGPGALRVSITPLGSMKIVARRLVLDLLGEETWICKHVFPIDDQKDENKEISIAHNVHETITEIANDMIDGPNKDFDELDRLAWKLWVASKRNHPSYCMFPMNLRKQNENYYKLVFEFKGHGVLRQGTRPGRCEQFNIDLYWDKKKGLIRCWGYDVESSLGQHSWRVQPSEFDEWFSPKQDQGQIIDNVISIFMQY